MKRDGRCSVCPVCKSQFYLPPSHRRPDATCSRACRAVRQSQWQWRDLAERFWSKVDKSGPCWLWTGATLKTGYGSIRINKKAERAHRVSFEMAKGAIPGGMLIRHTCDEPRCVNPDHLILGTHSQNAIDACERGQHPCGEASKLAKLSNADVRAIRAALAAGACGATLAKAFKVEETTISGIKLRKIRRYG